MTSPTFAGFAAILLAAGFSRRMGGENKLLKPFRGRPLIAHALETVGGLGLGQLVVVLGRSAEAVAPLLPAAATPVRNARASEGMGRSIAAGAQALVPALAGAFVVLGDMPLVTRADYEALARAFQAQGGEAVCIPVHEGRRGHPVLFPARHFPALAACEGDSGARHILADPAARLMEVETSSGVLIDFDDPTSFAAYTAKDLPENDI
jgi:molybdenum cofactor cytidylyltransferase